MTSSNAFICKILIFMFKNKKIHARQFELYTQCIIQYLIVMLALCAFRMIEEHYIDDILFVLNCTKIFAS